MPGTYAISAVYPRLLIQSGVLSSRALLRDTAMTRDQLNTAEMIDWQVMATMLRNLDRATTTPDWAVQLGNRFGISTHGSLGFAALSAPNLHASFQVITEYIAVRTTAISCTGSFAGGCFRIEIYDHAGDIEAYNWLCEMLLKNFESLAATQLGYDADHRARILLARPKPRCHRKLAQAYRSKLVFSAAGNAFELPADLAHRPSALHDEPVYRASLAKCVEILARRAQRFSTATEVRRLLQQHFDDSINQRTATSPPNLEQIAGKLHLTRRTLIRRLDAEQTSYKNILLELRRDYACSMLCDARLMVADVAERLGYREPANFGRAFKGWFGVSPAVWRRQE